MGVKIFIVLLELEKENVETYPTRYWTQKLKGFVDIDNRKRSFFKKKINKHYIKSIFGGKILW